MDEFSPDRTASSPRQHWALAVLCLLREGEMHPYEMRRLMKLRHKDERLVLRAGSLYNAILTLERQGLIEKVGTSREGSRPQRTVYRITDAGRDTIAEWIARMLGEIQHDVSSFAVGLDHLVHLSPTEALAALERRKASLASAVSNMDTTLRTRAPLVGRINLIEVEHDLVLCRAEHDWLGRIIAELRAGTLSWNLQEILAAVRRAGPKARATGVRK